MIIHMAMKFRPGDDEAYVRQVEQAQVDRRWGDLFFCQNLREWLVKTGCFNVQYVYIYTYIYTYTLESYILSLYVYVYTYCIFTENAGTKWMFDGYPANKLEFAYEATINNTWQFLVGYPPVA